MQFNIEKGIIPTTSRNLDNAINKVLPLEQMIKGDSIFVPEDFMKGSPIRNRLSNYAKKNNLEFSTQKTEKEGVTGTRVWKN